MATTLTPAQTMLTVDEVAARLKVSRWSVYRLIRRDPNPLPAVRLGGARAAVRISEAELERWLFEEPQA